VLGSAFVAVVAVLVVAEESDASFDDLLVSTGSVVCSLFFFEDLGLADVFDGGADELLVEPFEAKDDFIVGGGGRKSSMSSSSSSSTTLLLGFLDEELVG